MQIILLQFDFILLINSCYELFNLIYMGSRKVLSRHSSQKGGYLPSLVVIAGAPDWIMKLVMYKVQEISIPIIFFE